MIVGKCVCLANLGGDIARQYLAQNPLGALQQLVQLDGPQFRLHALAQVQQRARHFHAALGGLLRLVQAFIKRMVGIERIERQAYVSQDHRQLVVEIVGNEARQRAHHFQLLLFAQSGF
jgi:hypothetical protein